MTTVRLFWHDTLLARARAGEHGYTERLRAAFSGRGATLELHRDTLAARMRTAAQPGYALFHMQAPFHPRALCTRMAYFAPYWRIERSERRSEWETAQAAFDAGAIDRAPACLFCDRMRRARFPEAAGARRGGFVYVPLQGRLADRRSFQSMSPLAMIEEVLARTGRRPVVATLHPGEPYAPPALRAIWRNGIHG